MSFKWHCRDVNGSGNNGGGGLREPVKEEDLEWLPISPTLMKAIRKGDVQPVYNIRTKEVAQQIKSNNQPETAPQENQTIYGDLQYDSSDWNESNLRTILTDWFTGYISGSVTLVNNTLYTLNVTCPADEEWELHGVSMHNGDNVNRICAAFVIDSVTGIRLINYGRIAALPTAEYVQFPNNTTTAVDLYTQYRGTISPRIKGGNYVTLYWYAGGASAGGASNWALFISKRRIST